MGESIGINNFKVMKTLRFLGSTLLCVLISCSLSACGGGDDEESNQPSQPPTPSQPNSSKRLVKINELGDETIEFKYDNQGNLAFVSVVDGDEYSEFTYEYGNNEINVSGFEERRLDGTGGEAIQKTYYLLNGKVISISEEEYDENGDVDYEDYESNVYNFEYDNTGKHLARVNMNSQYESMGYQSNYTQEYNFSWTDGMLKDVNIVECYGNYPEQRYTDTYVYNSNPLVCKGFLPLLSDYEPLEECYLLIAKPELALMTVNCLPSSINLAEAGIETFTYEFDNDGYIRKVHCKHEDGNYDAIFIFTWE